MKWIRKILKITGFIFLTLIILMAGYFVKAYYSTEERRARKFIVPFEDLEIRTDSALLAEGNRLADIRGCRDCHDNDLGGKNFIDNPLMGNLAARNLTKGDGGLPQNYNVTDWLRALKHGIRRDSTALMIMPSHKFAKLSERDMQAIIAYCIELPPIDREFVEPNPGPLTRVLTDVGEIDLFPAELIDHTEALTKEIKPEITIAYGKYLANSCTGCHQENLKGGKPIAPGYPIPADLSSTGNVARWTDQQFIATMRTGTTPEGKRLDANYMPWPMTKSYTEVELKAMHLYMKSM
jgi:cytochrome c553